jgi:hypothetical protein
MTMFPARPPRLKKRMDEHGGADDEELRQLARQRCAERKSQQRSARQTSPVREDPYPYAPAQRRNSATPPVLRRRAGVPRAFPALDRPGLRTITTH